MLAEMEDNDSRAEPSPALDASLPALVGNLSAFDIRRLCECAAAPPSEPVGHLAEALQLHEQFRRQTDPEAAEKAIRIYETLLETSDYPGQMQRYHTLAHLVDTLLARFLYTRNQEDLLKAARRGREALQACLAEDITCPTLLALYSRVLCINADNVSHSGDLETAESLCRHAVSLFNSRHPSKIASRSNLAWILGRRFETTGCRAYVDEAIDIQRQTLLEIASSHDHVQHRYLHPFNLGWFLLRRHETTSESCDLEESIACFENSLLLCSPTHIDRGRVYSALLSALYSKCFSYGSPEDLDRAVDLGQLAIETERPPRNSTMNTVASLLSIRHQLTLSDGRDIEHALELRRQVLECSNPRSRHHSINLCNLASTLSLKFAWIGGLGNLEEAIQLGRQAADAAPSDLPQRYAIADDIANVLMLRFAETGEISDLNEALNWDRTAMAAISPSHARYSSIAVDMIAHLCTRFEHFHTSNDLEEAISLSEDILRSASANTRVHKPHGTYSLSKALLLRSQHNGNLHDVERAIQELEPVVSGFSERSAWPEFARTLARCFSARFRLIRHADDAHRALAIMNQLLMDVPPGYRERYQCLVDIAELYMQRDAPYYNLSLALENLMHALKDDSRDVRSRLQGAANMLDMIQTHHQEALKGDRGALSQLLDIYLQTISLLQRVAYFSVHLHSRLQSLKAAQNVALRGASIALVLCLPHKSLEILEQGRAIFWTHSLRLRSPFDVVPEDLRDRLSTLALQLDSAAHASHSVDDPRVLEATIAQRRRQTEDFNLLLKEIRGLPGLERFLMHDEFGTLTKAAERGPVVVLVSSTVACHAIIIKRPDDATSILIDRLPSAWLAESGIAWRSAMEDARADLGGRLKVAKPAKRHTPESAKGAEILRRLWVDAVKPILDVLGIRPSAGRNRPRVWWCPTGHFVHLPIHGAGADGIWCSDYVVSSYIPTLSSLRTTRANYERIPKRDIRALVASVRRSRMSQWTELPSTREEVSAVRRALPEEALIELPRVDDVSSGDGDGITAEALLKLLPQATILHLACHGHQDVDNPLQSGFVMQDEMLTIERLMPVPLPHAFMAFLSACETAKGDKEQPDQIVHLAATILFAGFKSVVATLWSMEDVDGPMIAQSVYQDIFCGDTDHINPDDVAYALDKAVQKLRLAHPEPSRWAPYIHLGM